MIARARSEATPTTTRSGRMKSSIAAPSFRNSGFETTSKGWEVLFPRTSATFSALPTGTVLLSTTTTCRVMCRPISAAAAST
jgi:hypothetical protein